MNKVLRTCLCICFCISVFFACIHAFSAHGTPVLQPDTESPIPLSYGKKYTTELSGCELSNQYPDDGTKLTDRHFAGSNPYSDDLDNWVGYTSSGTDFTVVITVDLNEVDENVRHLAVSALQDTNDRIYYPEEVRFSLSEDGETFTDVGNGIWDCNTDEKLYCGLSKLRLDSNRRARFIRVMLSGKAGQSIYICEVIAEGCANAVMIRDEAKEGTAYTDNQGVVYTIANGCAIVTDYLDLGWSVPGGSLVASNADFDTEGNYILGEASDNPISVHAEFVPRENANFSGLSNDIRQIVIHNTATVEDSTTADLYHLILMRGSNDSSWHYTVDNTGTVYHSIPDKYAAWHAGGDENYSSIGVELCVNGAPRWSSGSFILSGELYEEWLDTVFLQTVENTAVLVAELLVRYELTPDDVMQHYDCTGKNCPQWLRYDSETASYCHDGDLWELLMKRIRMYYDQFAGIEQLRLPVSDVVLPEYLIFYGGISYPVRKIADRAFAGKAPILCSVELSDSIREVAAGAFSSSYGLSFVTVSDGNPYFKVSGNCLYSADGTLLFSPEKAPETIEPSPAEGSSLWIEKAENGEYWLVGVPEGCDSEELKELYGALKLQLYVEKVSTGALVTIDGATMRLVIRGDANGDGKVSASDYMIAKRLVLGKYDPPDVYKRALMLTDGKTVSAKDYMKLKRYILGTYELPNFVKPAE